MLGRPFEGQGRLLPAQEWLDTFGPFDESGKPIPLEEQPLTKAVVLRTPFSASARSMAPSTTSR